MNIELQTKKLSKLSIVEQIFISKEIYNCLFSLNFEYPNFKKWYWSLFEYTGQIKDNREIIFCVCNNEIVGISILKKEYDEHKICTLRVTPKHQGRGIGKLLLEKSMDYLNDDKPLITIHISKFKQFEKLFKRYGFEIEQEMMSYYGFFKTELSYNGVLDKRFKNPESSIIHKLAYNIEKIVYQYPNQTNYVICSTGKKEIFLPAKLCSI